MIFKILLPALVALTVYLLGRSHARRGGQIAARVEAASAPLSRTFRLVSAALVVSVLSLAGWYIYNDWRQSQQTVQVRVVNTRSGDTAVYQAIRSEVHGRVFKTTDGRRITLADVERMEVVGLP